jgi:RHS repeat-associated protein
VAKSVAGVTTRYLVDARNLTGRAQVVDEISGGSVQRSYVYGLSLISQRQLLGNQWRTSFYGVDGHGSVRLLMDTAGAVTDTYIYDAFGNLIASTGSTPNEFLYAGERFDANLGFYYLRARYMNPSSGRFQTMDSHEGTINDPASLHKYLYANDNPVNRTDPSGHSSIAEAMGAIQSLAIRATVFVMYSERLHATLRLISAALTIATTSAAMKARAMR